MFWTWFDTWWSNYALNKTFYSSPYSPENGLVGTGIPKMIKTYEKKLVKFSSNTSWDIDQDIFTHEILSSGLCTLPENHKLWEKLRVNSSIPR